MATVWRGEDPLLARPVAVKTLDPVLAEDEALRTRFRREAVAAAAVAHPNIVATYDTGEDDGVAYIVMELVDGATLRQAIDLHGPLPPARAADIAAQVADALAAAHGRGLVHRDIKPSNVLVQLDGRVKVTDFGIAKIADQNGEDLTRAGNVLGTARYLAPEQLEGQTVDERADVYSLGLVLYEMLTGSAPFGAETEIGTAVARLTTAPPPLEQLRPGIPPGLVHVVDRALERDPARRWPNAASMRDALTPLRIAAPDRTADATMPVAMPTRTVMAEPATAHPGIVDDGMSVGARILIWVLALALGFGGGYAGYELATNDSGGSSAAPPVAVRTIPIQSVSSFDPATSDSSKTEHPEETRFAIDGDTATAWTTESYRQADVGGKPGVGLILELGETAKVTAVNLQAGAGLTVEVYTSDQPGTTLDDWGEPTGTGEGLGTDATIAVTDPTPSKYVLVWLTKLPPDGEGSFVGRIAEVSVRGVPA
jgi:serine/threonine-protein kinase